MTAIVCTHSCILSVVIINEWNECAQCRQYDDACVLKMFPFVFTQPNLCITNNLTNSSHFTILSVIERECTHAVSPCYFKVKRERVLSWCPAVVRQALAGLGGLQTEHLRSGCGLLPPPLHPLTPLFLFPATWSSHINHSQLNQQKAAGKCRGRGTIIHVAQPLMQICLLMKAFWARRICLTAILYMSAAWPGCPLALGMRSRVKFSVLLSVLFLRHGQIYLGLA